MPARSRRSAAEIEDFSGALLAYVRANPDQRGEQIAAALGTDATTMRPVMKPAVTEDAPLQASAIPASLSWSFRRRLKKNSAPTTPRAKRNVTMSRPPSVR